MKNSILIISILLTVNNMIYSQDSITIKNGVTLLKEYFVEVEEGSFTIVNFDGLVDYTTPITNKNIIQIIEKDYLNHNDSIKHYAGIFKKYDNFYTTSSISMIYSDLYFIYYHSLITYSYNYRIIDKCFIKLTNDVSQEYFEKKSFVEGFVLNIDERTIEISEERTYGSDTEFINCCDTIPKLDILLEITNQGQIMNCKEL